MGVRSTPPATSRPAEEETSSSPGAVFIPGDRVEHATFGQGIVLKARLAGNDEEVTVTFAGKGAKTLLVSLARLRKIVE
jgi:DNA helicase-2/ATP-dependent DNA helicase PcrA